MAATADEVDLVESPPKPAKAPKRQKKQPVKKLSFEAPVKEQPEASVKPAVLRRKKGKQADPNRATEAAVDPASPEVQKRPAPKPTETEAEAIVTPPQRRPKLFASKDPPQDTAAAPGPSGETADANAEQKDPQHRLLRAFSKAVPGIKHGDTVCLEESSAEVGMPADAPPNAKPKAAARTKKKEQKAAQGLSNTKSKVDEAAAKDASAEEQKPVNTRPDKDPAPKRKKGDEKATPDAGSSNAKGKVAEAAPAPAPAEEVKAKEAVPEEPRPEKKMKRRKKEFKEPPAALEAGSSGLGDEAAAEPVPEPKPSVAATPAPSTPKPEKDRADTKAAAKRKKKDVKKTALGSPSCQKSSGSPGTKAHSFRHFFRRRTPPPGKVAVDDDEVQEVIDLEAQKEKKQKFDWQAGFAKVQRPNENPGVVVCRPKALANEEVEVTEGANAANPASGLKKEASKTDLNKPEKVLVDWAEKHAPTNQKQLRPIKAWEQLRDWLKGWSPGGAKQQAALVTGPPGSGKTSGVRFIVRKLRGKYLEHDLEEPAGRNFIENMSKKQRDGRQLSEDLVFVCNLTESPTATAKDWLAQALQVARTPVIFVASEGMICSKDTALWKMCLEIRIHLSESCIAKKLAEVCRHEDHPLPEGLCEQVATTSPGDLRRALRTAQLLSVASASAADGSCFPEAAMTPIAAAGQLLGSSAEAISFRKSLDLIALDESVATLMRWGALDALGFFYPRAGPRTSIASVSSEASTKIDSEDAEMGAETREDTEELDALQSCARIASLVAQSDAAASWAEAAVEQAGTMPSEAAGSPAAAEPLLLACLSGEARRYASQKVCKGHLQLKRALPDPVCPITTDQIALLARQLAVPKAWVESLIFDWIIATRQNVPTRTLKNFRTWAKKKADRHVARQVSRQAARETSKPAEASQAGIAEPMAVDLEGPDAGPSNNGAEEETAPGAENSGEGGMADDGEEGSQPPPVDISLEGPQEAGEGSELTTAGAAEGQAVDSGELPPVVDPSYQGSNEGLAEAGAEASAERAHNAEPSGGGAADEDGTLADPGTADGRDHELAETPEQPEPGWA